MTPGVELTACEDTNIQPKSYCLKDIQEAERIKLKLTPQKDNHILYSGVTVFTIISLKISSSFSEFS